MDYDFIDNLLNRDNQKLENINVTKVQCGIVDINIVTTPDLENTIIINGITFRFDN